MSLHIAVESWDPDYGSPVATDPFEPSEATVEAGVEVQVERWRPMVPAPGVDRALAVVFVDGVRRIDAVVWITDDASPVSRRGFCASYAAGAVHAAERAVIEAIEVRRGLFSAAATDGLATRAGRFDPLATAGDDLDQLSLAVQQRLGALEVEVAKSLDADATALVVIDGPLTGRQMIPGAVGYVKTHRVSYLPPELNAVVARLAQGERSPLFVSTSSWTRYSWYLRLPGRIDHSWAAIVRIEASGDLGVAEAARLADRTAVTLPHYASVPHKEPRAPQNLFPIAGLERELRRRLGDAGFVQRALRVAASGMG